MKAWILGLACASIFATGCEFQQDPLSGANDRVRNGEPPVEKPAPAKALPKEYLAIDGEDLYETTVGETLEIKVTGRVMIPDVPSEMSIENLADFPGATFDKATGTFKWTPADDFLGGSDMLKLPFKMVIATQPTKDYSIITSEFRTARVIVYNKFAAPVIKSFEGPADVEIGNTYNFDFSLIDTDATDADDISILPWDCSSAYQDSVSALLSVSDIEKDSATAGMYTGRVQLILNNAQGLDDGRYCIGIVAVSKHGSKSNISVRTVNVQPRMRHAVLSLSTPQIVPVGTSQYFNFSIFDPIAKGEVTIVSQDDISKDLPGSSINCKSESWSSYQQNCTAHIVTTDQTPKKTYKVLIKTLNTSKTSGKAVSDTHTLYFEVK
jgi:hypothetical protein